MGRSLASLVPSFLVSENRDQRLTHGLGETADNAWGLVVLLGSSLVPLPVPELPEQTTQGSTFILLWELYVYKCCKAIGWYTVKAFGKHF